LTDGVRLETLAATKEGVSRLDQLAGARPRLDAKGVFAAVLGNGFEFFDFTVYATFLGLIGQAFFPSGNTFGSDLAAAATFGVGFIARPLGGAMIGAYGDRSGRKPAMTLSIALMAIGSAIIAITPGYAAIGLWAPILLILARLLQGFAVGGEVGPATLFMLEAAPPDRRMFFASWQIASQNLGSLASGLIGVILALALSKSSYNEWGWRVPFALGVLVAPVGVYIRSQLVETLDSPTHHRRANAGEIVATVLQDNWRGLLLGLALISGSTITQYFLITMTPYAVRTLHLPDSTAMLGTVTLGITGCLGALGGGMLADRFGVRVVTIVPRLLFMLLLFPVMKFLVANPSGATLVAAITVLSLLHAASVAVGIMLIPLIFPPAVRSTGMAICYSLGVAIFGGTATYVVTWLVGTTGYPLASTYYVMAGSLVMLIAVLAIRNVDYDAKAWPPPVDREV
jgi:predicted MFS family arabinose efflux permease